MDTCKHGQGRCPGVGPSLLLFLAAALLLSGSFALYLAVTGRLLPHDERFLGMTAAELCCLHQCRIVHFMIHDRASFGAALGALALVYFWLACSPLRRGEEWAWWALLVSGSIGFVSFLAYLGYGYLDTWHAVATLSLVPCFLVGLQRTRTALPQRTGVRTLWRPSPGPRWRCRAGLGRVCLLMAAAGLAGGGLVILLVGTTCVFVPQDLEYMGVSVAELHAVNLRLVPLIAHDRAGFGGAVCSCGVAMFFCVWRGALSQGMWRVLCAAGLCGFGTALGVHPAVGYVSLAHLAPALLGAVVYGVGLALAYGSWQSPCDAARARGLSATRWMIARRLSKYASGWKIW